MSVLPFYIPALVPVVILILTAVSWFFVTRSKAYKREKARREKEIELLSLRLDQAKKEKSFNG